MHRTPATDPLQPEEAFLVRGPSTPIADMLVTFERVNAGHLSPRTIHGYLKTLREFDRWVGGGTLADLTIECCAEYVAGKRPRAPFASRLAAATLKAFASWLAENRYIRDAEGRSVLASLRIPRVDHHREPFTSVEVNAILQALRSSSNRTRARDSAAVLTLLAGGLRLNELRELRVCDITFTRPIDQTSLLIRWETSKSRESRRVIIGAEAATALHLYIEDHRPPKPDELPVFLTEQGRPFTYWGFTSYLGRIRDRFEAAGIGGFMAHRGRHFWATRSAANGLTLPQLKYAGGWRDNSTPLRYAHAVDPDEFRHVPNALSSVVRRAS